MQNFVQRVLRKSEREGRERETEGGREREGGGGVGKGLGSLSLRAAPTFGSKCSAHTKKIKQKRGKTFSAPGNEPGEN